MYILKFQACERGEGLRSIKWSLNMSHVAVSFYPNHREFRVTDVPSSKVNFTDETLMKTVLKSHCINVVFKLLNRLFVRAECFARTTCKSTNCNKKL